MMTGFSSLRNRYCLQKPLKKNLRAPSCMNINEHIYSFHILDSYGACC